MRLLRKPTLEADNFELDCVEEIRDVDFQKLHATVYAGFEPGENASNLLRRAIRYGVLANGKFSWLDRREYNLSAALNPEESGRVRRFGLIPEAYLATPQVDLLLRRAFKVWSFEQGCETRAYECQMSAIRYGPSAAEHALPSPIIPHQDMIDGTVVVMAKTAHLVGGTSRLYSLANEPLYECDLEVGEMLSLRDAQIKHQVTPILLCPGASWRPGQIVYRDILIIRFQPLGR